VSYAVDGPREVQAQRVPEDTDHIERIRPAFVPRHHRDYRRQDETQQQLERQEVSVETIYIVTVAVNTYESRNYLLLNI
jgi:hypothetical protein